jgi:hypothetical protein
LTDNRIMARSRAGKGERETWRNMRFSISLVTILACLPGRVVSPEFGGRDEATAVGGGGTLDALNLQGVDFDGPPTAAGRSMGGNG